jgi:hypothetical protein
LLVPKEKGWALFVFASSSFMEVIQGIAIVADTDVGITDG